ncbi:unnamed protein product [Adineta steineri]|uniref:Uncharacterized protein n=1 Tax=Adineta steineri TaxID=433720 RepID=A0A813NKU6_9BILA|nr:unnamed protein product [Adineta steineri]
MLLALQGYKQQVSDTLQALKTNLEQLKILQKIKQNNHSTQQRHHRTASHEFSRTNQNVYLNHLLQMSQPSHRAASNQFGSTGQNLRLNYPIAMSHVDTRIEEQIDEHKNIIILAINTLIGLDDQFGIMSSAYSSVSDVTSSDSSGTSVESDPSSIERSGASDDLSARSRNPHSHPTGGGGGISSIVHHDSTVNSFNNSLTNVKSARKDLNDPITQHKKIMEIQKKIESLENKLMLAISAMIELDQQLSNQYKILKLFLIFLIF